MAKNWYLRIEEDKNRLSDASKYSLLKALIKNVARLNDNEAEAFLLPTDKLQNLEAITTYSVVERKIAKAFGGGTSPDDWGRDSFLEEIKTPLQEIYSPEEIQSLFSQICYSGDATVLVSQFARDHYGMRRIRNAYLPEITDFIEIDPRTGIGVEKTKALFAEGPEDSVSRIERILGIKQN